MRKFVCMICGYVYDEAKGSPETGIAAGTKWEALPEDWVCPLCGATQAEFKLQETAPQPTQPATASSATASSATAPSATASSASESHAPEDFKELTALEASALCSNLARGCEKQYKPLEAELFTKLAQHFEAASPAPQNPEFSKLLKLIEADIENGLPAAFAAARAAGDRGAQRALVWSEKVTLILKSILTRYEKEGDAMLENASVYVCTICGFIYIGNKLPDVCPVCKVPNWKFDLVEGGRQ